MKMQILTLQNQTLGAALGRHAIFRVTVIIMFITILLLLRYHLLIKDPLSALYPDNQVPSNMARLYIRSQSLAQRCSTLNSSGLQYDRLDDVKLLQSQEHKMLYCGIPKIGTSFWRRVFLVLNNVLGEDNVFDIPHGLAHHTDLLNIMSVSPANASWANVKDFTKFMFSRDPFSRLYSAYVDKIMLPTVSGSQVTRDAKAWANLDSCKLDLSFAALCDYIATSILNHQQLDPHFAPMYQLCDPCHVNFTLLGKMETFMEDNQEIVKLMGLDLSQITRKVDEVDIENDLFDIFDVTERSYYFLHHWDIGCATEAEVLDGIWKVLQIRGLLSKDAPKPEWASSYQGNTTAGYNAHIKTILISAFAAYIRSGDRDFRDRQRKEYMIEAYRTVPKETIEKLTRAFATDCALFGYLCDISDLISS